MSADVLQNRPLLVAAQVTRRFGGLIAVNKVDFTIPERSIVSLIGPNGAGKTTFFNVLLGVIDPSAGEVQFQGRRMIARPERIAFESLVWVMPALIVGLLGAALAAANILSGRLLALVGFVALMLLRPEGLFPNSRRKRELHTEVDEPGEDEMTASESTEEGGR